MSSLTTASASGAVAKEMSVRVADLLSEVAARGIRLSVDAGQLQLRSPRGALTAELREQLSTHKEELVRLLGASREENRQTALPPLSISPRNQPLPLSFSQERLWFLNRFEGPSATYNIASIVQLRGRLDVAAFRASIEAIVARHEILRTTFAEQAGQPTQQVAAHLEIRQPLVDFRHLGDRARHAAERLAIQEARRPFDLGRGPLLASMILRLSSGEHWHFFNVHHIVYDGSSAAILIHELTTSYGDFVHRRVRAQRPLPVQYGDYAVWQRGWLRDAALDRLLGYWRRQLADAPSELRLPADRPRPASPSYRGRHLVVPLGERASAAATGLARRTGVTPFMALLALFAAVLRRSGGQDEMLIGSPIAGREVPELAGLLGFFVNTLVLRLDLRQDPTLAEMAQRVRGVTMEAFEHQQLPFEKLVEELRTGRGSGHQPFFQVVFQVLNVAPPERMEALEVEWLRLDNRTSKFDLDVTVGEERGRFVARVSYSSDLFDAASVLRLLKHYRAALATVGDGTRRLGALDVLEQAERHQIVHAWNPVARPSTARVDELFARCALQAGDRVAVACGDQHLSYAELERRSARLAAVLRRRGVGPEERVGVFLERSTQLVEAILGIVRAGAAYVPFHLDDPPERLAYLIGDAMGSGTPCVLSERRLVDRLPSAMKETVLCLDELVAGDFGAEEANGEGAGAVNPESLLYVVYTSGSTGRPKGAAIPHRSVVRLVRDANFAEINSQQVFLLLAPVSFDASTLELWGALLNGARLEIAPPGVLSLEELGRVLRERRISLLWLTGGLFNAMADQRLDDLLGVGQLLAGGEALSVPHVERVLDAMPTGRLINGYGPTENTTFTCCHGMAAGTRVAAPSVPIGRPIRGTRAHLLDAALQPVPIGVAGELLAGGVGLARGYFERPGLTAERFVPDPLGLEPGARLYRTGDQARLLHDGRIEFLGRDDDQVKIRGFRIEIGEVETALGETPGMRAARVIVHQKDGDAGPQRVLVAYFVPETESASVPDATGIDLAQLRASLGERLPAYMVPATFVELEELPLTANGKLDRDALPDPSGMATSSVEHVEPRDAVEQVLATIWREMLEVERVGVEDDFFELGGHSLLATRVASRVKEIFRIEVSIRAFFENPTLAGLATALAEAERQPGRLAKVARAWQKIRNMSAEDRARLLAARRKKEDPSHAERS